MYSSRWFRALRGRIGLTILCVLFVLLTFFSIGQPGTVSSRQQASASDIASIASIDSFISTTMQEKRIPGVAIAIIHNSQVVHERGFGRADESGRSVTPSVPFEIGSMTKSFTALAIMQLIEQGKINLNAPVQRYLPWFHLADPAASACITVAHLLHHTSGIPASVPVEFESLTQSGMSIEQYVRALSTVSPDRPVGDSFEYSNSNYVILGLIVQVVAGEPYTAYVQRHIFDPLHMQNTFFSYEQALHNGAAQGYNWLFGVPEPVQHVPAQTTFSLQIPEAVPQAQLPAGGIISSAEDMSHYLVAMMNGGRCGTASVLSRQGVATLQAASIAIPAVFPGEAGSYGMGWFNGTYYGIPAIFHTGTTLTFKSFQFMNPQRQWGAIILMNAATSLSQEPFDSMKSGIVHLLMVRSPEPVASMTLNMLYFIIDLILAMLSIIILWNILNIVSWYRQLPACLQLSKRKGWLIGRHILYIGMELCLGSLCVASVAILFGSFAIALMFLPDLSGWLLGAGFFLFITGLIRGILFYWRLLHKNHQTVTWEQMPVRFRP